MNHFVVALALSAVAAPLAAQVPGLVQITAAERIADRVHIRIATQGPMHAVQSEPFHMDDGRTRVFITLPGGTLDMPFDTIVPTAGMLSLRADAYNGAVRLTADVAGLGDYGVEPTEEGLDLWLDLARPATAAPAPAATDWKAYATKSAANVVAYLTDTGTATLRWARAIDLRGPTPLRAALIVTLLLITLIAWKITTRVRTRTATTETGPDLKTARMREARTLAHEGLGADAIARRTGIARDVATLLVANDRPAKPAGPGTLFRPRRPSRPAR